VNRDVEQVPADGFKGYDQPNAGTVFLAEDDAPMRELLTRAMARAGFRVLTARSGVDLLDRIESTLDDSDRFRPGQVIVSDVRMRRLDGFGVLKALRQAALDAPCILITAFGDEETHARAAEFGADAVIDKPFDIEVLLERIRGVLARQRSVAVGLPDEA